MKVTQLQKVCFPEKIKNRIKYYFVNQRDDAIKNNTLFNL